MCCCCLAEFRNCLICRFIVVFKDDNITVLFHRDGENASMLHNMVFKGQGRVHS